jgi:transposase
MEACGSSHHWARELSALGHEVRLIPPQYVKPFVKRAKNDRNDAEAICEAGGRPGMRFVPVKSADQQAQAMVLKVRETLIGQRTQLANSLRGHPAEFGVIAGKGIKRITPARPPPQPTARPRALQKPGKPSENRLSPRGRQRDGLPLPHSPHAAGVPFHPYCPMA